MGEWGCCHCECQCGHVGWGVSSRHPDHLVYDPLVRRNTPRTARYGSKAVVYVIEATLTEDRK